MRNNTAWLAIAIMITASLQFGCSGAIDKVVDSRVTKMVVEENKKLPSDVGHGIQLVRIDYDETTNKLVMKYSAPDKSKLEASFERVKRETNEQVYNNGSLSSAFDHDVKVFHEFYNNAKLQGRAFKNFQTPKPK